MPFKLLVEIIFKILEKFIYSVDISFFLKSNSISIRDVGSVSCATSRFEIEIEIEFEVELRLNLILKVSKLLLS